MGGAGSSLVTAAAVSTTSASTSVDAVDPSGSNSTTDTTAVLAEVQDIAAAAGGTIAVTVLDADGTTIVASSDARTPVYTASLVKLLVVQQLLQQAVEGTLVLTPDDLQLMQDAMEASDDDAMSELWVAFDGAALVEAAVDTFGLTGTASPIEAGQWGLATTTAADYATVLAGYSDTLAEDDADLLTGWLQSTTSMAADGFDQTFGVLSLDGDVGAKQGWMCCVDDTRWLHSTGVLADGTVVVLLGTFPASTGWTQAGEALDAAAAAVVVGS